LDVTSPTHIFLLLNPGSLTPYVNAIIMTYTSNIKNL